MRRAGADPRHCALRGAGGPLSDLPVTPEPRARSDVRSRFPHPALLAAGEQSQPPGENPRVPSELCVMQRLHRGPEALDLAQEPRRFEVGLEAPSAAPPPPVRVGDAGALSGAWAGNAIPSRFSALRQRTLAPPPTPAPSRSASIYTMALEDRARSFGTIRPEENKMLKDRRRTGCLTAPAPALGQRKILAGIFLNLLPHTGLRAFSRGLRGKSDRAQLISQRHKCNSTLLSPVRSEGCISWYPVQSLLSIWLHK